MFSKPFVVLDLETSGIDNKKDDIIEVAMIRYENGKEVKRHDALIKVDYKLPKIITIITGITDKDLEENGQDKGLVFEEIEEMLDGVYMVAHNIAFDHGFLDAKGLNMNLLGLIDTIPLAQILMPESASYSLEALSDDLGITHVNKHRAMGDVEATLELFKALCNKADALPPKVLKDIREHLERSKWEGGVIFSEASPRGANGGANSGENRLKNHDGPNNWPNNGNTIRKALEVEDVLNEGGVLQKFWEDYEPRSQQVEMSSNVMNAFNHGYHLICEAPTGVGKSLAYLIPAANTAIKNKSKVVISTNTINLQEQLYEKDIPLLQKIYREGTENSGVRAALLKGRSHYLCLRRFAKFKERENYSDDEMILLTKILVWEAKTHTGDSGEIHLSRNEQFVWDFELCSEKEYCSPKNCKPFGECYIQRARQIAEEADIIVVNHALLCADLESDGNLLPDYNYLIVDEAHHFEDSATKAFGMDLKEENFALPLKLIAGNLEIVRKKYDGTLFGGQLAMEKLPMVTEQLSDLRANLENLFTIIALFVNKNVQESTYVENLLVDQMVLGMEEWLNLTESVEDFAKQLRMWIKELKDFVDAFMLEGKEDGLDNTMMEIMQEVGLLLEQVAALNNFFGEDEAKDYIRWCSSDQNGNVGVHLAPMVPGSKLKQNLYAEKKSIIFTSATLGVKLQDKSFDAPEQHPFTYFRRMLDLGPEFEELMISSPFDFEKQAYVMVPNDIYGITNPKSTEQLTPFFEELIKTVGGNMLSLFTSYRMIETLYLSLMQPLQNEGVRLLAQRISGGRNKIMKAYKQDPAHSVLFGTASFWEGIDIQGDALSTLVMHKLPFDMPNDPILKARGQMFNNGFFEYSVPRAILKFRQGFGRLIRSKSDYGVMVVLDNRVLTKEYGKLFLQALPDGITLEEVPLDEVPQNVDQWLGLSKQS